MAESRRLRTQADAHGNVADDCGHCTLLPGVNGPVRAVQTGCPVHGDWVRTQAERDADGTTWRPTPPHVAEWLRQAAADSTPAEPDDIDRLRARIRPPRRRWWHRYTRRTR